MSGEIEEKVRIAELELAVRDHKAFADGLMAGSASRRKADAARIELLEEALGAIHANAASWHGNGEKGPRRALAVIAGWAADPSSIPEALLAWRRLAEVDAAPVSLTRVRTAHWDDGRHPRGWPGPGGGS